jgi:uncharacterized membrane protein (Fun14 family)
MTAEKQALEDLIFSRTVRLNAMVQGIVTAVLVGAGLFLATIWLVIKGGDVVGPRLALLNQFFPGYTVSFLGSLVGLGYGALVGFVVGYLVALIYNWLLRITEGNQRKPQSHTNGPA